MTLRGTVFTVAAAALAAVLTACGGSSARDRHPFAGTWHGAGGAGSGIGGTTLTVAEDGKVAFTSTVKCTGTAAPAGGVYRFAIDCGIAKFTGTAPPPPKGADSFVMTWSEGDSTVFRAAS
ncbi:MULTISPECIES: hypothetical protein [Thermomonospora]|mgnify:CR=1 FL=1|uniref:Lipoprotein n=1 Tax=Thermomonospora curvata (strain ATCC 19995 / DSM 43183 / JCM 3096 / KCTC 9072 / NBRC 15933 / NCIMB 10081 / Henssen B9) TaxID=471852 RepID=D1A810_THECD|nr:MULTISPECIES: hypothetical protein [Thermomonospora]ACY98532.1 hypothetical protein Tcur_2990 [Thermomonospora curvata DSM 43183]PKK13672.1 MAG: hypothetical protein BUE48_014580 [Thermomonospora sp. CIF 1]